MDVNMDLERYPQFQGFDQHVARVMEEWNVHGTAIAVVKNGEVIFSKGYGWRDFEHRLPVDSQTLFAIGSASKAFTSTALGILADRGKLEWDQPVRKYLPSFALMDPFASERITPRDLLSHRSGLPGHNMMWFGSPASRQELVGRLAYLQPNQGFRSVFQYQNMMFVAAGQLVEELSGQAWEEFVQREIFDRLGMNVSNFSVEVSRQSENVALPYRLEAGAPARIPFANIDTVGPAGSINSNLEDMARWVMLQLSQGLGQNGRLISAESLAQIHKPVITIPADFFGPIGQYPDLRFDSYALGWFIQHYRGHQMIHHGGHIDGYAALISFMPEIDAGVVFLSNDNRTLFVLPLSMNVYDLLLGLEMEPWSQRVLEALDEVESAQEDSRAGVMASRKQQTTPSQALSAYTGRYLHPGYDNLEIVNSDGSLLMHYNGQQIPLKHFHYDVFAGEYEEEGNPRWVRIQFLSSLDGEIDAVTVPFEPAVDAIRFIKA